MNAPLMHRTKYFVALLLTTLLASEGFCARYYVRTSGNDNNNGLSRTSAFRTIGQALTAAQSRDTIYVGAGTYDEYAVQSRTTAVRSITLQGDTSGRYTGDKGEVIVRSSPSRYSLYFYGNETVYISNITFTSQRTDSKGHGIYADGVNRYFLFYACKFEGLTTGAYGRRSLYLYGYKCEFTDCSTGTQAHTCEYAYSYYSGYKNCRTAFQSNSCENTVVYDSHVFNDVDASGNTNGYMGFRADSGTMWVTASTVENARYPVYGVGLDLGTFQQLTIKNPRDYGIYAKGEQLSANSINVEGLSTRKGWGIRLNANKTPYVKSVRCSALYGGFYSGDVASVFNDVEVSECHYGLYIPGSAVEYIDNDLSGFTATNNNTAIISVRSNTKQLVSLANAKLHKNMYGIVCDNNTELSNCEITECRYGIKLGSASYVSISGCKVTGDSQYITSSQGIYASADQIAIVDTAAQNFYTGLRIKPTSDNEPKLHNIELTQNPRHGLYVDGGTININENNKLYIADSLYGIHCRYAQATIDGVVPKNSELPLSFTYGSATVRNVSIEGARYAVQSSSQDSLQLSNVETIGSISGGAYINRTKSVNLSKCQFKDGKSHGVLIYYPEEAVVKNVVASDNGNMGIYIQSTKPLDTVAVTDCVLRNNYYGVYTTRVAVNPETFSRLAISGCRYGIRSNYADMVVTDKSELKLDDNLYAISCANGSLECSNLEMSNNDVNVHASGAAAKISNSKLSARRINVQLYSGDSSVSNCTLDSGAYGLYFAPRSGGDDLRIEKTEINNTTSIAFFAYGNRRNFVPKVEIDGLSINTTSRGIYGYYSDIKGSNVEISSPSSYGLYQIKGSSSFDGLTVANGRSWGVYSSGDSTSLRRSKVSSRYGVYLSGDASSIVNSVVKDSTYGVYATAGKHQVLQSTIANVRDHGVYLRAGDMVVRNTIIDAGNTGLYNANRSSTLEHDYNLISADKQTFINATAGLHEIEKEPIFADPLNGDFHLSAGSPAINAGMDLSNVSTVDIEGNARPSFRQFEIGAFEFTENAGSLRILDWKEESK